MGQRVFVTRPIPQAGIERLEQAGCRVDLNSEERVLSQAELREAVRAEDAVLCQLTDRVDRDVLEAAREARIFANAAVGYNNIDVAAATERGIAVTNTPGVLTDATADLAWALLLATARRLVEADRFTREGRFKGWEPMLFLGAEVTGRTLGLVGAGRIGTAVALRSQGFKMQVLYTDPAKNETLESRLGAGRVDLDTLLEQSDFVSLHVPLTDSTRHMLGAPQLKRMRRTAILINTSRGPVIDEEALIEALQEGRPAAAGLDVFEEEPALKPGLAELDNVVLLPHIGSATQQTRSRMATLAAENIIACLSGKRPPNLINPEVLDE